MYCKCSVYKLILYIYIYVFVYRIDLDTYTGVGILQYFKRLNVSNVIRNFIFYSFIHKKKIIIDFILYHLRLQTSIKKKIYYIRVLL